VGYLLSLIRLRGPEAEIIEQIVRLSIRYGIVTPYTSYLVRDDAPIGTAEQERIVEEQLLEAYDQANAPTSGQGAVEKAAGQGALADAETPVEIETSVQERLRIVGSRTFVYSDGVWIDTTFVPEEMQTGKIEFLTDDYFNLLNSKPDLAGPLALGSRVIVVYEGGAIEVVESPVQNSLLPQQAEATATPSIEPIATRAPSVQDPEIEPTDAATVSVIQADEGRSTPGRLPCAFALISPLALPILLMFVDWSKRRV
jgi:Ca-activated chloride channel family protein